MLLELADHDGDVDRAIELLAGGEDPRYAAIIARLKAAGREDEVLPWIDRAVAGQGVLARGAGSGDRWLSPEEVADAYLASGRTDDAIDVLRASLLPEAGHRGFARLLAYAETLDRADEERGWALAALRQQAAKAHAGAVLIEIALAEGDHVAAWAAADEFGVGYAWSSLAQATAATHPSRCAALHRAKVEEDLRFPNSSAYPGIAATLVTIRDLSAAADEDEQFAEYLAAIREDYRRRPSLMAALDRAGL